MSDLTISNIKRQNVLNNCWWFSATDVVRAINDEPDYTKTGNYWHWWTGGR